MEDHGFWQVLLAAPDDPANARVHQPIPAPGESLQLAWSQNETLSLHFTALLLEAKHFLADMKLSGRAPLSVKNRQNAD